MSKPSDIFEKQSKIYNFRDTELKKYRKEAAEITDETTLIKRFKKTENIEIKEITKERLEDRGRKYGENRLGFKFELNKEGKFRYIARNKKTGQIISHVKFLKGKTERQHKNILLKRIQQKEFDYEKLYIKEDTEPVKEGDPAKDIAIRYTTYYRFGIIIYRVKDGKKYEIIYQDADSQSPRIFISYQRLIAEFKANILNKTGITIEEWIYLSKTQKNIYVEGGFNYKRYKFLWKKGQGMDKPTLDYQFKIDFEEL